MLASVVRTMPLLRAVIWAQPVVCERVAPGLYAPSHVAGSHPIWLVARFGGTVLGFAGGVWLADTICSMSESPYVSFRQRMAEKEAARRADALAIAEGRKTPQQIKLENESFAFGPDRATLDFASLHPVVESVIALIDEPADGGRGV